MNGLIPEQHVWFAWAVALLVPWSGLWLAFPVHRRLMLWASFLTLPFGATEPRFVPRYWNPPSLFDLARRTGFDLESFIFCFAIGGIGVVLVNVLTRRVPAPVESRGRAHGRHRLHAAALLVPFLLFPTLALLSWNPIHPSLACMTAGAATAIACRPDLARKTWAGGVAFLAIYAIFLAALELLSPGYVRRVWNVADLSGVMIFTVPIEELRFAMAFGMYWSSVYEHFAWLRPVRAPRGT